MSLLTPTGGRTERLTPLALLSIFQTHLLIHQHFTMLPALPAQTGQLQLLAVHPTQDLVLQKRSSILHDQDMQMIMESTTVAMLVLISLSALLPDQPFLSNTLH